MLKEAWGLLTDDAYLASQVQFRESLVDVNVNCKIYMKQTMCVVLVISLTELCTKHNLLCVCFQVSLRRKRTGFPNWSSWTLWVSCAAWTWCSTRRIWSRWSFCCWRLLAGTCACPRPPTLLTTTSTPRCKRATCTTAGPCRPSPRPRPSWTNTLTTFWKCHCKVGMSGGVN